MTTSAADLAAPAAAVPRAGVWRRLCHSAGAMTGLALVVLFVVVALAAPLLAPYSPVASPDLSQIRPDHIPGFSAEHPLGLDQNGRDELSRLIYGARSSLLIGLVSTLAGALIGIVLGGLAGAFGGWVDAIVMRVVDIMLALPGLLFAIGIAAMLGKTTFSIMIAIAVVTVPAFTRLLRGAMLAERERDYVVAATSLGLRRSAVTLRHILPNSLSPVLVQATLTLATAIIDAAALAFLGLGGDDPSTPEWGRMLADAQDTLTVAPRLAFLPCVAIILVALGFTLLGESLREALDPKGRR
ncbi:ABC transporter permease [Nonomuraea sp. NPDC050643]|uniref:ABC transporter permease n=1 Tax=Nonomuraea sp. NPDC050643 TaxID=3155660 RepID=UPI0033FD8192